MYAVGLYHSMNTDELHTHWLLRFIPDLKRDTSIEAKALKNELKNHLEILLNHHDILLFAPERVEHSQNHLKNLFKQRYMMNDLWENLNPSQIPGSPWIKSISTILNDTNLDYRLIGNIVKLITFKSCESYTNQVPYITLIIDILNSIPVV